MGKSIDEYGPDDKSDITIALGNSGSDPDTKLPLQSEYRGMMNRSKDLRLVVVFQKDTHIPIYLRYVPDRLLRVSTLSAVNNRMESLGIGANFTIMDSECCNIDNITKMCANGLQFTMMVPENNEYYGQLLEMARSGQLGDITSYERDGFVFGVSSRRHRLHDGYDCHLYAVDIPEDVRSEDEPDIRILVSSEELEASDAVSMCFVRYLADKLATAPEEYIRRSDGTRKVTPTAIRGHLLVSFIAASIIQMLRNDLDELGIDAMDAYEIVKNQKCKVFSTRIVPTRPTAEMQELYGSFGIDCPAIIPRLADDD